MRVIASSVGPDFPKNDPIGVAFLKPRILLAIKCNHKINGLSQAQKRNLLILDQTLYGLNYLAPVSLMGTRKNNAFSLLKFSKESYSETIALRQAKSASEELGSDFTSDGRAGDQTRQFRLPVGRSTY